MANKNQQYFRRELKAGIPQTIDFGARFVFIEAGREITVIGDGNRISKKRKGDKVTFDEPVKSISFESPIDQVLEITAGFGDFNRVIVQGDVVAHSGLLGYDGQDRPDTRTTKSFNVAFGGKFNGYVQSSEFGGQTVYVGDTYHIGRSDARYTRGLSLHNGFIYTNEETHVVKVPVEGGYSQRDKLMKTYFDSDNYINDYFHIDGEHWGTRVGEKDTIFKYANNEWSPHITLPYELPISHINKFGHQLYLTCGGFLTSGGVGRGIFVYDLRDKTLNKLLTEDGFRSSFVHDGKIYAGSSRVIKVYNLDGGFLYDVSLTFKDGVEESDFYAPLGFYRNKMISVQGDVIWRGYTATFIKEQRVFSGNVSEGDGGNRSRFSSLVLPVTSIWDTSSAELEAIRKGGRKYIRGEVIKYILQSRYGDSVPKRYLDHVYGIKIPNSSDLKTGTRSFELMGIRDDFEIPLNGNVELILDSEITA